ncbi:hypothetical protein DL764_000789 [Monosporascus ibericus]|uniref:C3H1-type domain-containing protein n=1 Tax=Monosporascus ibericus TaxID=155417 RepID=A0A4Q4TVP3_9PEZI|nr:hypothetical protein DL764_000789 [Monosporascus ibericus]
MSGSYHYGPPPPPPATGPRNVDGYYAYPSNPPYTSAPPAHRGGASLGHGHGGSGGGRGGHYQGPGSHVGDYNRVAKEPYPNYPERSFGSSYGAPQPSSYWQGNPQMNPPRNAGPVPVSSHPSGYAFQGYQQPPPSQEYGYSSQAPQSYPPAYHQQPPEYRSQQWGRGGYQGDRGGHKSDHPMGPPIRIGFDRPGVHNPHNSGAYGQPYNPPSHHQAPVPYPPQPHYSSQPPVPVNAPLPVSTPFSGHSPNRGQFGSTGRGHGRNHFGQSNKGRPFNGNTGGEKFRNQNQRPSHHVSSPHTQKSEQGFKKKKRKTNTLGLTPGNDEDSDEGPADEESYWVQKFGNELPAIPNLAAWIAERKANYPTKKRIEEKKKAEALKAAQASDNTNAADGKIDSDEEKLGKLQAEMSKVEQRLKEKRKRPANDEGDDMRLDNVNSDMTSIKSEDEKPESLTTHKPASLPPPPLIRADPTSHCKYYATGGKCGKKDKCRFKHDPAVREAALQEQTRNGGRLTLKQRLMLNDKNMEDRETVEAILSLRSNGRILDPQNPEISRRRYAQPASSTLPPAPSSASLPPNPNALGRPSESQHAKAKKDNKPAQRIQQGWDLSGFNNTGLLPREPIPTNHHGF